MTAPRYVPFQHYSGPETRQARASWVRAELARQGAKITDLAHGVRVAGQHLDIVVTDLSAMTDREVDRFTRVGA